MTNRRINHADVVLQLMRNETLARGNPTVNLAKNVPTLPPLMLSCYVFDAKKLGITVNGGES